MGNQTSNPSGRPQGMSSRLLVLIGLLVLATGGAVLLLSLQGAQRMVEGLCRSLVERSLERNRAEARAFFDPVRANLQVAQQWGRLGLLDRSQHQRLNDLFIPFLKRFPQVSSLLIGDTGGKEYMLLRLEGEWRNRLTDPAQPSGRSRVLRWSDSLDLIEDSWSRLDYDPRSRPWFSGALSAPQGEVHWTPPYAFFTTGEPGVTASVRWETGEEAAATGVVAFDILLTDIAELSDGLKPSPNGRAVALTQDGLVIARPSKTPQADSENGQLQSLLPVDRLGSLEVPDAWRIWKADDDPHDAPFRFRSEERDWWGGFTTLALSPQRSLVLGVIVPESDFVGEAIRQRNHIIAILLCALAAAALTAVLIDRSFRRRMDAAVSRMRTLGQYTLDSRIGKGGMGAVYRASHSMLRRPVAVKLLRPDKARSETSLARFEKEVQITSLLTHPNTIDIYDYGRTPSGVFYYVMEYLAGADLDEVVRASGPLCAERVIHILTQVCASLREAHEFLLIHRDIKPGNIILCEQGGMYDFVKVLDFGLVKEMGGDSKLTLAASLTGTPHYMSPEIILEPATAGPSGDLYALGAVGYYLLCGRTVFDGDSPLEICTKHLTEEPIPPSRRFPGDVPADLEKLILGCLQKKPEQRPSSAEALAAELRSCAAAGSWTSERARGWWDRQGEELLVNRRREPVDADRGALTLDVDLESRAH